MAPQPIAALKALFVCTALSILCTGPTASATLAAQPEMTVSTAERDLADAKSLEERGSFEEAIQKYRAILKDSPSSAPARRGMAIDLAKLGRCDEAQAAFGSVTPPTPHSLNETEQSVGACYFRMHNYKQAIIHLENVRKARPGDKEACIDLARVYAAVGRGKEGIAILKASLAANPRDVDVLYWIGTLYHTLAQQVLDTMTAKDPNHYLVHELEGDQLRLRQDFQGALTAYQEALKAAPNSPGMHFNVGDAYYRMLKLPEAKDELEKELTINPYHAQANYEFGEIHLKEGKAKEAITYLQRAVKLDPALMDAHRALGRALISDKRYDAAIRELSVAAKSDPSDHTIHAMLATAYRQMGRIQEAEQEAQISQKLMSDRASRLQRIKTEEQEFNDEPSLPPENH